MILTWSASCKWPTVDMTTSTCFMAFTKVSWSYRSPCHFHIKRWLINQITLSVKWTGEWRMISYMDQINAQSLKMVDELSLGGVRDGWFSHQSKSWVPRLCACFHNMFTDVAGASDDQNLAFLGHSSTSNSHSTPLLHFALQHALCSAFL